MDGPLMRTRGRFTETEWSMVHFSTKHSRWTVSLALGFAMLAGVPTAGQGPPLYEDKMKMLVYLDAGGRERAISNATDWEKRRAHILANMEQVMGPLPDRSGLNAPDMEVLTAEDLGDVIRKKVSFLSEPGDRVPAYLLVPKGLTGKAPAMLCLHQTTEIGKGEPAGVGGIPDLHYGLELARRGYVTLAPDYVNFGEYEFDPYQNGYASATMKGIWNHMRAVDLLQSLPEVDAGRIGCIGHSLGGHNSMYLSAFDRRLKVVVSSCGFNSFFKYYGGDLTGWSHPGYMPRISERYGKDPKRMPFDFTEVVAALAPRGFFINAPLRDGNFEVSGVRDCVRAAAPVYALFGAPERLLALHPDAEHAFPPEIRERAYAFVDEILKGVNPRQDDGSLRRQD
ncbi:MAG: prolyl oligopeptidase family serine peptidase [Gemmatimonadota bacterium]|nr:prolyl oligopeptidase family serine peptidase [Gemmatimonadota bacterium]